MLIHWKSISTVAVIPCTCPPLSSTQMCSRWCASPWSGCSSPIRIHRDQNPAPQKQLQPHAVWSRKSSIVWLADRGCSKKAQRRPDKQSAFSRQNSAFSAQDTLLGSASDLATSTHPALKVLTAEVPSPRR